MKHGLVIAAMLSVVGLTQALPVKGQAEHVQVERATTGKDYVARRSIGQVEAIRTVNVRAAVEGFLTETAFQEGASVKEGDVLFRIDPLRYQAAVQQAEATLARIDAQIIYATNNYKRLSALARSQATSEEETESALAKLEELKASRAGAQADLTKARKDLSDCTIRAEITGKIGRVAFAVGNYITAGETLATIVQVDPIYVRFPLSQSDVNGAFGGPRRIDSVTDVRLVTAGGAQYPTAGHIEIVDNLLSDNTDSYTLWAKFENPDNTLIPRGIGALLISMADTVEVTTVPLTAVHHDAAGSFVYTVADDGTVARRDVISGSIRGRLQSIYDGLRPEEMVITDGAHKTREGAKVIPVFPEQKKLSGNQSPPGERTAAEAPVVSVKTAEVQTVVDPTVLECHGARVEAISRVDIRPLVQGILSEPGFKEGDHVNKDDILFVIDPTRYQAAVDAQLAAIKVLDVRIADARVKLTRQQQLAARRATSRDELESAQAALDELLADKAGAEAALTIARDNLSRCTVRAKIDGRIGRVNFSKGNYIADIKSPLATLMQLSPVYVRFSLSENDILSQFGTVNQLTQDVVISLVTATGKSFSEKGRIAFCDNLVQSDTDTLNIWAIFDNSERLLQPGGVVTIRLSRSPAVKVPAIPAESVLTDTRGHYTFVVRRNRAREVRIHCGTPTADGLVPVYSGVRVGDSVIRTNLAALEDGTPVSLD